MTNKVSGTVRGFIRGLNSCTKESEGLDSVYMDSRARMSENISMRPTDGDRLPDLHDPYQVCSDMCTLMQNHLKMVAFYDIFHIVL